MSSNKVNKGMDELKKQWKKELWLKLYDNFIGCEYHGYNNVKPLFDSDYVLEFDLSEKLKVELRNSNLQYATLEYCDEWLICGEYTAETLIDKYDLIWDTKKFEELRKFVVNFYDELIDFTSKLLYDFSIYDEPVDNDIIKDQINVFLSEKLI